MTIITIAAILIIAIVIIRYENEHTAIKTLRREGYTVKKHAGAFFIWLDGEAYAVLKRGEMIATAKALQY